MSSISGWRSARAPPSSAIHCIGVPLFADTVVRKASVSKGIAEKRDLQWSIPVFATAIIKI